jgi:hypothetical protein
MPGHLAQRIAEAAARVASLELAARTYRSYPAAAERVAVQLDAAKAELDRLETER